MKKLIFITTLFLATFTCGTVWGQQSSGMQFLNFAPNAQSLGISEAHTAVALGAPSIYTNPALLSFESQSSATLSHRIWRTVDEQTSHATVNLKRDQDAFGFGIISSVIDDIEQRSGPGESSGNMAVRYLSIAAAYSREFGPFSLGATGTYLYEQLFQQNAGGYAFSAGIAARLLGDRVRLGSVLLNYGQMQDLFLEATELPTSFKVGADIQALQFRTRGSTEIPFLIAISSDFVMPLNELDSDQDNENKQDVLSQDEAYFNIGLRIEISELITLRSGYKTGHPDRNLSFGGGVRVSNIDFDYAFAPFDTGFGTIHGISVGYYF